MKKIFFFIKSLKEGGFTKNVLMITGGAVFSQGLSIVLSPVITRLYSPSEYGILTVYVALLGMVSLLGALSYDSAIPIADDDEKAFNVLVLCLCILFLVTSILLLILTIIGDVLLILLKAEQINQYKYFIPIGFFLTGLYTVISQWSFRKKEFKSITVTQYSQSLVGNTTKIALGLFKFGPIGLILGNIFSQSAGILTLIKPNSAQFKNLFKIVKYKEVKKLSKRYIRFPLFTAPGLFVLSAAGQLPIIFMSSLYGATTVGLFGFAKGIAFLPMTIIGKSVQDVFYAEASSIGKKNPTRIKELSNKLLKKMIIIGCIPMLVLVLFAPFLFSFVFGLDWLMAGEFARLLSIFVFCHFIFHPISTVFSIFEQQKKAFVLSAINLIIVICVFGIAKFYNLDKYITVLLYSISMAVVEVYKYVLAQKIMDEEIVRVSI